MSTNYDQSSDAESDAASETDSTDDQPTAADADSQQEAQSETLDVAARAELLAEENRRLRTEYARARRSEYRRTALGLAVIGVLAILGGVVFPDGREVLFAFGFTGLFGAVLTLYLTPTRIVAADVGERTYAAMAANDTALAAQLGLTDERVYVPDDTKSAVLYVPQNSEYELPAHDEGPLVVTDGQRGLLLEATGAFLFEEFEQALTGDLASAPGVLASQLSDGAVEQFELADAIEADVESDGGRITFRVSGNPFGDADRFDHPLSSFLATGLAAGLDSPVRLEVDPADEYADWLVTCRWSTGE